MKKVLVINTGGTIAMKINKDKTVTPTTINPLDQAIKQMETNEISIVSDNMYNVPSPSITPNMMFDISKKIQIAIQKENFDGIVVTHGTDTLEETAYFLDLVLPNRIPIVITGAMKAYNSMDSDGLYNLQCAINTAASDDAYNYGVMVVLNDEINYARTVTKTNTTNVDTFKSPLTGPLGIIVNKKPLFIQKLNKYEQPIKIKSVIPNIYLLIAYSGMDSSLFNFINNEKTNGLVIEGLGSGNLPPSTLNGIKNLLKNKIPIVLVSRCINGIAQPIYGCESDGFGLKKLGVTICQGLNGVKARIRLIVGLSAGKKGKELSNFMSNSIS